MPSESYKDPLPTWQQSLLERYLRRHGLLPADNKQPTQAAAEAATTQARRAARRRPGQAPGVTDPTAKGNRRDNEHQAVTDGDDQEPAWWVLGETEQRRQRER